MTTLPIPVPGAEGDTLMWTTADDLDERVLGQLQNIANLPWVEKLRVMPDVHLGMGATIGSVIAMRNAVSPSAVGVDIGCGVAAVKTSLKAEDLPDNLHPIRANIERDIPVGFKQHRDVVNLDHELAPLGGVRDQHFDAWGDLRAKGVAGASKKAWLQSGTLGGGNHFIELCLDDDQNVWITLHSGSRKIGKDLAERHIAKAKTLEHNLGLPDRNLAVFLADTEEMDNYLHDLHWAQKYAAINRSVMLGLVKRVVARHLPQVEFSQEINCHHNYVAHETYDGVDLIVTRKGAIRAGKGDLALITGSMGTGSYVVRGLGNDQSLQSASHGAGRKMSRHAAVRNFTLDDLAAQTNGVECRKDSGVLDEIPGAYKSIESVIENQTDLVSVEARLQTILCVKG